MFESLSVSFFYSVAKDAVKYLLGRQRKLSNSKRLELRQKWKPQFEAKIREDEY